MIYFDTAYIAKCYFVGAERVRELAYATPGLASCELARLELNSVLRRRVRERHLSRAGADAVLRDFERDEAQGVWRWFGVSSGLVERARQAMAHLPEEVFLRAADALHLACAQERGFREIYSNDRHMLAAAPHFQLVGVDVLAQNGIA